jgi:hypothetical protein
LVAFGDFLGISMVFGGHLGGQVGHLGPGVGPLEVDAVASFENDLALLPVRSYFIRYA